MIKSTRPFYLAIIFVLTSLACFGTGTQNPENEILLTDDFSNTHKKWDQVTDSSGSTEYYNQSYRIVVNNSNYEVWANPGNESFIDTQVEVDATKNGGPNDNDFGIICRYIDESQFYFGVISSDGYYGIMKMTSDGPKPLGRATLMESNLFAQGAATNQIRFDCIGTTLSLYVNGSLLDQQDDAAYTTGNVGLIAGSFDTPGTDILFDNFVVSRP